MKLVDYLRDNRTSLQAFADLIGVKKSSVHRYLGSTIPSPSVMTKIVQATGGIVGPADFYDAPEIEPASSADPSRGVAA